METNTSPQFAALNRSFFRALRQGAVVCALLALGACSAEQPTLYVSLITDLRPAAEWDGLRVALNGEEVRDVARVDQDYQAGVRIAGFEIEDGVHEIVVSLLQDGVETVRRPATVQVAGTTTVTVIITRNCVGVACPGVGAATAVACLGGVCVDPTCSPETPELCPPAECMASSDCPMSAAACAPAACRGGVCFVGDDGSCGATAYCDPSLGCRARMLADASVADSGLVTDAGPGLDGGVVDTGVAGRDTGPGTDAGTDTGVADAGPMRLDAGTDASMDAGTDAGMDAGDVPVSINARAILRGAHMGGGLMSTRLSVDRHIPLNQPFGDPAFLGTPKFYTGTERLGVIPPMMVDWVLLDVRDGPRTVGRRAAVLLEDGRIQDLAGGPVTFPGLPGSAFRVVLRSRNHLSVIHFALVDFFGPPQEVDFTLPGMAMPLSAIRDDAGFQTIECCDGNSDERVNVGDMDLIAINLGRLGYQQADYNMNGSVDGPDMDLFVMAEGATGLPD